MKNHDIYPEQSALELVNLDGEDAVWDPVSNTTVFFDETNRDHLELKWKNTQYSQESQRSLLFEGTSDDQESRKKNKIPYSRGTKVAIGSLIVGAVVLPPAAHAGAEYVAFNTMSVADPFNDKTITHDELWTDMGITVNKLLENK